MLWSIANVCCWRDLEETLLRLPAPLSFYIPPGNPVLHLEKIDLLAWAPSLSDLMGSVYSLVSVALSVFHCCVAEIHSMLWFWRFARRSAFAPTRVAPSEVPYPAVVGMSLALVSAPSEVPAYSD